MRSVKGRDSIVRSALRLFGERGIEATSLREVAKAAEISPALVVHHFGSKAGLVAALDEVALLRFAAAYQSTEPGNDSEIPRRRAEQTALLMRNRPDICLYFGRALTEGTPGSTDLFRLMIGGGQAEVDSLAEKGALREDADRLWATLQHFLLFWAPLSFLPALERLLDGALLDQDNLDRWVAANVQLLEGGLYR